MAETWIVTVESTYVFLDGSNEMYPALTWTGAWSWLQDLPNGKAKFYGEVNPQVKGELSTSPNVVLLTATLYDPEA